MLEEIQEAMHKQQENPWAQLVYRNYTTDFLPVLAQTSRLAHHQSRLSDSLSETTIIVPLKPDKNPTGFWVFVRKIVCMIMPENLHVYILQPLAQYTGLQLTVIHMPTCPSV